MVTGTHTHIYINSHQFAQSAVIKGSGYSQRLQRVEVTTRGFFKTLPQLIGYSNAAFRKVKSDWLLEVEWHVEFLPTEAE